MTHFSLVYNMKYNLAGPHADTFQNQFTATQMAARNYMIFANSFNTLRPRQNGRHFPDDTLKRIFLNEKVQLSIKNSLNIVP